MSRRRSTVITSRSTLFTRSSGDAGLGLAVDPRGDGNHMEAVLTCVSIEGVAVKIVLTAHDVLHLAADAQRILGATSDEVSAWWFQLTGNAPVPGPPPPPPPPRPTMKIRQH